MIQRVVEDFKAKDIPVQVGSIIKPEAWFGGMPLLESDWDKAQFRLKTMSGEYGGPVKSIAVNIKVTGKTYQRFGDDQWIRVQIEWVGDGEPSTFSGGWLKKTW